MLKTLVFVYGLMKMVSLSEPGVNMVGIVKDSETQEELVGVQVIINEKDTLYTNLDGQINYVLGEEDLKTIEINYQSYESKKYVFSDDKKVDDGLTAKERRKMKKEDN